jgi:hypothetical protein
MSRFIFRTILFSDASSRFALDAGEGARAPSSKDLVLAKMKSNYALPKDKSLLASVSEKRL